MNNLLDNIGEREPHSLTGLLDIVTFFVRDYEGRHVQMPDAARQRDGRRADVMHKKALHVSELPANVIEELGTVAIPKAAAKFNFEYKKKYKKL